MSECGRKRTTEAGGRPRLPNLPDTYAGWVRRDRAGENEVFTFWRLEDRGTYTPIYRRVTATYREQAHNDRLDPEIKLSKARLDAFGHTESSYELVSRSAAHPGRVWRSAKDHMDDHPGADRFDEPPRLPTQIGDWELVDDTFDTATWGQGFGRAELTVEQTDVIPRYQSNGYRYTISYVDVDAGGEVKVTTDVPRRQAHEIAVATLRQLPKPLSEMDEQRAALEEITGVGPAKARQLLLLGVTSPETLAAHIAADSSIINHHHAEAVDKVLTSTIRDDLGETDDHH